MSETSVLQVNGLCAGYGQIEALKQVSLRVMPAELVAIVGANGAGKTTLLRTISGLISARSGRVSLHDKDITTTVADERVRRGLAQVLEGRQVFGPLSVEDNLALGSYTRHTGATERLDRMFDLFPELKAKRAQPAWQLSGGQQQMLALGRALMSEPKVLLLDEPSMGLAPLMVQRIFEVIQKLRATGIAILLVEQNARAALSIADRAYVLENGKVSLEGPASELASDDRVRSIYLGV